MRLRLQRTGSPLPRLGSCRYSSSMNTPFRSFITIHRASRCILQRWRLTHQVGQQPSCGTRQRRSGQRRTAQRVRSPPSTARRRSSRRCRDRPECPSAPADQHGARSGPSTQVVKSARAADSPRPAVSRTPSGVTSETPSRRPGHFIRPSSRRPRRPLRAKRCRRRPAAAERRSATPAAVRRRGIAERPSRLRCRHARRCGSRPLPHRRVTGSEAEANPTAQQRSTASTGLDVYARAASTSASRLLSHCVAVLGEEPRAAAPGGARADIDVPSIAAVRSVDHPERDVRMRSCASHRQGAPADLVAVSPLARSASNKSAISARGTGPA